MTAKNIAEPTTLSIDVDTSGLQDALAMLERVATAAKAVQSALAALGLDTVPVPVSASYTLGELQQDETPALILAELKSLREEVRHMRTLRRVGGMRVRK
jgi:hypothetical protein